MSFDEIMLKITNGLTGDRKHDIPYLRDQCEHYKEHDMAQEILRACGRLMYKYITEDQKESLEQIVENQNTGYESILEEVRFRAFRKQYKDALILMVGLIKKIEQPRFFSDDAVSEYRCFNEFFEEALYRYYCQPQKTIRRPPFPFDVIYLQYGSILVDLQRIEEARTALEKAVHWNPASADIAFEHAETYKMTGDLDTFFRLTIKIFKYAFRPEQVARCYRNLGYCFIEKNNWKEAAACYSLSLHFDKESKNAMSELYYIHEKAGEVKQASMDEMRSLAAQYGFPLGADEDVLGIAFSYGRHLLEQKDTEGARYCLGIAYSLTQDESIKELIDALPPDKTPD